MGINSRDYVYRDSYEQPWGHDVPVCRGILIATVVVFLAQIFTPLPGDWPQGMRPSYVDEWLGLNSAGVLHGQVWRLVTYAFVHDRASVFHILFNMLGLWWFGPTLERMRGSREFLFFYLAAATFAGLGFFAWGLALGNLPNAVGASGAVFAVLMLYATYFPREKIGLFFGLIFLEIRWLIAIFVAISLFPMLLELAGDGKTSRVADSAHLAGLLFGYLYRRYDWRLDSLTSNLRWPDWRKSLRRSQSRRQLKVFTEDEDVSSLDEKVDAILAKLHNQGSDSLTDAERATLKRASERYKQRSDVR
ncbi:MAG: rhomboid family intramembrane serine protease [Planctomycetaceae bacterium]|jgi:membrane associated rhomboid family serine protease|nr:rhomboid family intramembrane serine protease [Planctomycetaceae bacterium]